MNNKWNFIIPIVGLFLSINVFAATSISTGTTTTSGSTSDTGATTTTTTTTATTTTMSGISDTDLSSSTKALLNPNGKGDTIGSYADVVKQLQSEQVAGNPYEACLSKMMHSCSDINKQVSQVPPELQDAATLEMIDACFEKMSFDCGRKFDIVRTGDVELCYEGCNFTREADLAHCQKEYVRFSNDWELCKNEAVFISQRCYRSCSSQLLPISINNTPLTTDPLGIGTDDQKLISIYRLMGTPLPSGCNW